MPKPKPALPTSHGHRSPAVRGRLLGEFLRARRDRSLPADFGLAVGARRRAPGLRREEAAALCGISPTWYAWIEQGRSAGISAAALNAIARGLKLSRAERAYLFELAARSDASSPPSAADDRQRLDRLLQVIRTPAYVLDRHWDAIAWNRAAAELFEAWLGRRAPRRPPGQRNLLRYVFLDPHSPSFIADWPQRARRLVAEYRADTAAWREDPVSEALVNDLCGSSAAFEAAWRSQEVLSRAGGRRVFQHPQRGRCLYQQFTLRIDSFAELKLTVLVPVAATAHEHAAAATK